MEYDEQIIKQNLIEIGLESFHQCVDIDSFYNYIRLKASHSTAIICYKGYLFEAYDFIQVYAEHNNIDMYEAIDQIEEMKNG